MNNNNVSFLTKRFPQFKTTWSGTLSALGNRPILDHPVFVSNYKKSGYSWNDKAIASAKGIEFLQKIQLYESKIMAFNQAKGQIRIIKDKAYKDKVDNKVNLYNIVGGFYKTSLEEVEKELKLRLERVAKIEVTNSKVPPVISGHQLIYRVELPEKDLAALKKQHDDILDYKADLSKLITKTKRDYNKEIKMTAEKKALEAKKLAQKAGSEAIDKILNDKELKTKLINELKKELNAKPKTASNS